MENQDRDRGKGVSVLRILMVEDERMVARGIKRLVSELLSDRDIELVHVPGLDEADVHLARNTIDLLLLDLNLSGEDGFDLLSNLTSHAFQTIIISANTDRAIQSYEYGVLDFVPKPVSRDRLGKAFSRLSFGSETTSAEDQGQGSAVFLSIRAASKTKILNVGDVAFIEAAGKYSEVHLTDGHSNLHEKSLTALLQLLPANFQRVHRSSIVNLDLASQLISHEGSKYELQLAGGKTIRVGRAFVKGLRDRLT